MAPSPQSAPPQTDVKGERGFVLLAVLATLGLLALVAATFAQVARSHIKFASAASESAKAEAIADAGAHIAILDLVAARGSGGGAPGARRFTLDATPLACRIPGAGTLVIAVQDEAGKVDLNIASPELLRALALGAGFSAGEAAVDAILDYRDEDDNRRVAGAERPEYQAAGRPHGPRNGPFLAVEDLAGVLGITQADADRVRPFITIHSGLGAIDVNVASQALVDVLARGFREGGGPSLLEGGAGDFPRMEHRSTLPPQFLAASTRRAFSIRSQGRTTGGAVFVRETIVEFIANNRTALVLRRWRRGSAATTGLLVPEDVPSC